MDDADFCPAFHFLGGEFPAFTHSGFIQRKAAQLVYIVDAHHREGMVIHLALLQGRPPLLAFLRIQKGLRIAIQRGNEGKRVAGIQVFHRDLVGLSALVCVGHLGFRYAIDQFSQFVAHFLVRDQVAGQA